MPIQEFGNEKRHDNDSDQKLLMPTEVAQILGISKKTVHKLVRDGKLGCVQVTSKERRFTQEQIDNFFEVQSQIPKTERIDFPNIGSVSSPPKKGGERSFGVSKADLRQEMRLWQ